MIRYLLGATAIGVLHWLALRLMYAAVAFFLVGCVSAPVRLDNAQRLTARPDFPAAAQAAPEWCRDALKTINALELQLERK